MTKSSSLAFTTAIFGTALTAVWTACNKEPQPEGRTALEHAYECEEVLGPLPRFSCADAVLRWLPLASKEQRGFVLTTWRNHPRNHLGSTF